MENGFATQGSAIDLNARTWLDDAARSSRTSDRITGPTRLRQGYAGEPRTPDPYLYTLRGPAASNGDKSLLDETSSGQGTPMTMAAPFLDVTQLSRKLQSVQTKQDDNSEFETQVPLPPGLGDPIFDVKAARTRAEQERPPAPQNAPQEVPGGRLPQVQVVSLGSIGHPHSCQSACKYRKRKTGCLMGASCPQCHLCHWRRQRAEAAQQAPREQEMSLAAKWPQQMSFRPGSMAPENQVPRVGKAHCGEPAYVSVNIDASLKHQWEGEDVEEEPDQAATCRVPVATDQDGAHPVVMSVGSLGHPYTCNSPCKYNNKKRGCKEAATCDRCHLCRWTRSQEQARTR
jgi:hypothetical protein